MIKEIQLNISNKCNLRCVFCYAHSACLKSRVGYGLMDKGVFLSLVDSLVHLGVRQITVSGDGEPTLHPNFSEFIKILVAKIGHIELLTNGTFDGRMFDAVLMCESVVVNFSAIDERSYMRIHRPIRRQWYKKFLANVVVLKQFQKRVKRPFLKFRFIINRYNYRLIRDYFKVCEDWGIDNVDFKLFKTRPGTEKMIFGKQHLLRLQSEIESIGVDAFNGQHNLDEIKAFLGFQCGNFGTKNVSVGENFRMRCPVNAEELYVSANGCVFSCEENRNFKVGDLKKSCLEDSINSDEMKQFQRKAISFNPNEDQWKPCLICPYMHY